MRRGPQALLLLLAGCSYDWTVARGAPPSDAGRDALPADASVVDASDASPPEDAIVDSIVDSPPSSDGTVESGPDCNQLEQNVNDALGPAISCQMCTASTCLSSTPDQCNCTVYVCDGMSPATANYIAAVNAFKDAGCLSQFAPCGDTCPLTMKGVCSLTDAAGKFGCFR